MLVSVYINDNKISDILSGMVGYFSMSIKIRHKVFEIFICFIKRKNLNITNGTVHWCDVFRVSNELKNLCAIKMIVLFRK